MAKKVKITKGGQTVYPATVMDAVVHPDLRVDASKLIEEVNVSKIYPTGGIDGTNKYTLETAIAKIPSSLRTVGLKCSFLDEEGKVETWTYQGGTFTSADSWMEIDGKKIRSLTIENESLIINTIGISMDSTGIAQGTSLTYSWSTGSIYLKGNCNYILEITGNLSFNSESLSPYYQIVGTDLANNINIIDTYVSKQEFEEETITIFATKDVNLKIRARGYESGVIQINVYGDIPIKLEEIHRKIDSIKPDTIDGLYEKKEKILIDIKDNYIWRSPDIVPVQSNVFCCSDKIPITKGETINTKNWNYANYAAILFDSEGEIVKDRVNSNEFTTDSDGSKSYTIQDENTAYIGLNQIGIHSDNQMAEIFVIHSKNTFNYSLIEEKIQAQIDASIKLEEPKSIDVYIIAGQSNADGRGYINQLDTSYKRIYSVPYLWQGRIESIENMYSPTSALSDRFGVELSIASELEFRNTNAIILKRAIGGIPLYPLPSSSYCWKIGENNSMYPLLKTMVDKVKETYGNKTINWKFAWLQGETDAEHQESAAAYESNMRDLIGQLRLDTSGEIKIAIAKLKESTYGEYISDVNNAFESIANGDQYISIVDTSSLELYDAYHYTTDSFIKLGTMLYDALAG